MVMDFSTKSNNAVTYMIIGGLSLNAIGIWLAWSMKQLWILHDPDRSLVAGACGFGDAEYDPEEFENF